MSEFIGSRISLISKSDIRYVGTLHNINSEESTVALENVKSYGTEGRREKPEEEMPGSDSIYEYIVFRGSDVKDLRIEEPPKENKPPHPSQVPNDPAILGSARPPQPPQPPQQGPPPMGPRQPGSYQQQGPYPYQQPPYNQRFNGPPPPHMGFGGPPPGPFPGYNGPPFPGGPGGPGGPGFYAPPGQGFPPQHGQFPQGPHSQPPPPPSGPRGQAPQDGFGPQFQSKQSGRTDKPSAPTDSKSLQSDSAAATEKTPAATQAQAAPRPPVESKPNVSAATPASVPSTAAPSKPVANGKVVPALPQAPKTASKQAGVVNNNVNKGQAASSATQQYQSATQAATAAVAAAMAKLPAAPASQPPTAIAGASFDNLAQKVAEMRVDERSRSDRGGSQRGRGGARRGGREPAKPVDLPKNDFDFESANAKFNKSDLVKEAIASGSPVPEEPASNGAAEVTIPPAPAPYNKSSFFDDISSEAKEREKASEARRPSGHEFRSEERKKNMETFGQGSVDNRYGYRGRGRGGRGRGRGGFRGRGAVNNVV